MCLTYEWFTERYVRLERLTLQGCWELEPFLKEHELTWDDLVASDLLRLKPMISTAEIMSHTPTAQSRNCLIARAYDILVVRKGKGEALREAVCRGHTTKPKAKPARVPGAS